MRSGCERTKSWPALALGLLLVLAAAGCGGPAQEPSTPTPEPTEEPTPFPTPLPTPTPLHPPTETDLVFVCYGRPAPLAASYGGKVHPLVVVDDLEPGLPGIHSSVARNKKWLSGEWQPSQIQLVVCQDTANEKEVKVGSCGTYQDNSGHNVQVTRYRWTDTIRVVVAKTGRTLQTTVIKAAIPKCDVVLVLVDNGILHGNFETPAQLNSYATAVSTQKVQ
jgi:hypothetical protein